MSLMTDKNHGQNLSALVQDHVLKHLTDLTKDQITTDSTKDHITTDSIDLTIKTMKTVIWTRQ